MTIFNFVGLYKIVPTLKSLSLAAKFYKYDWLLNSNGGFLDEVKWEEFANLGLLEFKVFEEYTSKDLLSIQQNSQSPYLEFYLDPTGVKYLDENAAIKTNGRRVCFFLHFIDLSCPLHIGEQKIYLPAMSQLPVRLIPYAHYVPVD